MAPENWSLHSKSVEGLPDQTQPVFPYPHKYGGTIADDANKDKANENTGGMMAFDIRNTNQHEAEAMMQQLQEQQELAQH